MAIFPGQRYMSETEPELGLGLISEINDKQLTVLFQASETRRTYGIRTAPLKRVLFEVGDKIKTREGLEILIEEVFEHEGLIVYCAGEVKVLEVELDDHLAFNNPEEKLYNGQTDNNKFFQLRLKTLEYQKQWETSPVKGLLGGRIAPMPHQLYVANEVLKRQSPRVLLADEVGLGKTIEAGLIIHKLVTTGRAERVLVVVPDSLVYQWFFEMHRKFQLGFRAIGQDTPPEEGSNPFVDQQRVIVSLGLLKGSKLARELLAEAEFDILVVDEAHQYKKAHSATDDSEYGFEYELLENLCERIPSVLLLTATPEQLGMEGHFDRLQLLDPDRYSDFQAFKEEVASYQSVAVAAREVLAGKISDESKASLHQWVGEDLVNHWEKSEYSSKNAHKIIKELIDRHGTGRIFFRNTRSAMRKEYDFFPKRIVKEVPLKSVSAAEVAFDDTTSLGIGFHDKAQWLSQFLETCNDKVLLICHSKKMIVALERLLKERNAGISTALFHSGLSLMARDRQAAYFASPNGAQILLCTEIGSEGRNFEFAHHLVLFDLPKKPDLLEQRIGRLDRIGQKQDINIYIPYISDSWEEGLFHIYDRGLNSFRKFSSVGTPIFIHFSHAIHAALQEGSLNEGLLREVEAYREKLEKEVEESRDLLIEMNSFDPIVGNDIVRAVKGSDASDSLAAYMDEVFDCFGVDNEDLHEYAQYIKPNDNMFIPHFPYLESEGQTITYDRREALEREDYQFLNWDHAMVREVMNLILSESYGNMTVATRRNAKGKKSFVEAYYVLDCPAPDFLDMKRFFPPTLIRVMIDKEGEDFAQKWTKTILDEKCEEADREALERATKIPKNLFKELIKMAETKAHLKASPYIDQYRTEISEYMNHEVNRLRDLAKVNPAISQDEVDILVEMKNLMLDSLKGSRLRLEAIRLIL